METWRGHQMHSHNYRSGSRFAGQVVVVVGNMCSGEPQQTPFGAALVVASVVAVAASSCCACRPAMQQREPLLWPPPPLLLEQGTVSVILCDRLVVACALARAQRLRRAQGCPCVCRYGAGS